MVVHSGRVYRMSTLGESTVGGGLLKSPALAVLADMMKIHAVALFIYGLAFFLVPRFTLVVIFGFEQLPSSLAMRAIGSLCLAISLAEWACSKQLSTCLEVSWFFILSPLLILFALVWERVFGHYQGTELFFWTCTIVLSFISAITLVPRLQVKS